VGRRVELREIGIGGSGHEAVEANVQGAAC